MTSTDDLDDRINATTSPYQDFAHTGPGTLGGRFMRSFWQPVGISDQVAIGRAYPITVMSEEFVLYRGETGTIHLLDGRCAHRGTQLSIGTVEADCIRCFYHGWAFDGTGQCVDQAIERPSFAAKVKIGGYPVYEYLGLIFAYLGEGEPPPKLTYPEFEHDCVVQASSTYNPFNFFSNMENNSDALHLSWVHRMSNFFSDQWDEDFKNTNEAPPALQGMTTGCTCEETEYGFRYVDLFTSGETKMTHIELPNVLHVKTEPLTAETGWRDLVSRVVPIDDTSYRSFSWNVAYVTGEVAERYLAHPRNSSNRDEEYKARIREVGDAILAGELRLTIEDCGEMARQISLQDYIAQKGQGTIPDRAHERLGRSDRGVMFLRDLWSREMENIDKGRPIKHFRWPGNVDATTGAVG